MKNVFLIVIISLSSFSVTAAETNKSNFDSVDRTLRLRRLELKRPGPIKNSVGFRIGAAMNKSARLVNADGNRQTFDRVYRDNWYADVAFFYDYYPFYYKNLGTLGFGADVGINYLTGSGVYEYEMTKPDGSSFGAVSKSDYILTIFPIYVGPTFKLNVIPYIQPYATVKPGMIFLREKRLDDGETRKARSTTLRIAGGLGVQLDWISQSAAFSLYEGFGIKHIYLTAEYQKTETLGGPVQFTDSVVYTGTAFEF